MISKEKVVNAAWAQLEPFLSPHFHKRSPYGVALWEDARARIIAQLGHCFDAGALGQAAHTTEGTNGGRSEG